MNDMICESCKVHIERAVFSCTYSLLPQCCCKYACTCTRQYLSNDGTVRTCFSDFFDRFVSLEHVRPQKLEDILCNRRCDHHCNRPEDDSLESKII